MGADLHMSPPPSPPGKGKILWGLRRHYDVSRDELAKAMDILKSRLTRIETYNGHIDDEDFRAAVWFIMESSK